jgi:hypothetical protein
MPTRDGSREERAPAEGHHGSRSVCRLGQQRPDPRRLRTSYGRSLPSPACTIARFTGGAVRTIAGRRSADPERRPQTGSLPPRTRRSPTAGRRRSASTRAGSRKPALAQPVDGRRFTVADAGAGDHDTRSAFVKAARVDAGASDNAPPPGSSVTQTDGRSSAVRNVVGWRAIGGSSRALEWLFTFSINHVSFLGSPLEG